MIIMAMPSDLELKLSRTHFFCFISVREILLKKCLDIVGVFGFKTDIEFSRDEFFLFLDSLFRGLTKVLIVKGETKPVHRIKRISSKDLSNVVSWIYKPGEDYINREEFLGYFLLFVTQTKMQ